MEKKLMRYARFRAALVKIVASVAVKIFYCKQQKTARGTPGRLSLAQVRPYCTAISASINLGAP
jgi:hypothetical protein